jgi:hypothetical protein
MGGFRLADRARILTGISFIATPQMISRRHLRGHTLLITNQDSQVGITPKMGLMTSCNLPIPEINRADGAGLQQLKVLLQRDPDFAQALRISSTTLDAARLAAAHGVRVTPEAIWRNRGRLFSDGLPTWRG